MKKIALIATLVVLAVVGFTGYKYYESTYQDTSAYAQVPTTTPEKKQTVDDSGKQVDGMFSYTYTLNFVKEDGTTQKMEYVLSGENPEPLAPGSYVQAKISSKRITESPKSINKNEIPKNIVEKIDK
ncbi:MAG: YxeA family protein [Enterococcus sp.]